MAKKKKSIKINDFAYSLELNFQLRENTDTFYAVFRIL